MEPLFKKGDRVRIKDNFAKIRSVGDPGVVDDMLQYAGQICTVRYHDYNVYTLYGAGWSWSEEWLEFAEDIKDINENEIMSIF